MRNRIKISALIICFLIMMPLMVQNVQATDTNLGQQGSIPGYRGSCVYFNVTEASNFDIYLPDSSYGYIGIGDMFKFTILGEATFSSGGYNPFAAASTSDINPCIIGGMDYYNSSLGIWTSLNAQNMGGGYTYYRYNAFLMYNSTSENYFCAESFHANKYLMLMLPTTLSLAKFGDGIMSEYNEGLYPTYDGVVATTTSLNFSFRDNPDEWNYMEVSEKDGANIVQEWEYQNNYEQIKTVYLNHTFTVAPPAVQVMPFGSEIIIILSICVVGLIIIIKKKLDLKER